MKAPEKGDGVKHRQSAGQETKLRRFLTNVRYLGDVGKAAGKTRVSRKQLDAWMNDHAIAVEIDTAVRAALVMAHGQETKQDIVFRAKIAPQLEMDGEVFQENRPETSRIENHCQTCGRGFESFALADRSGGQQQ